MLHTWDAKATPGKADQVTFLVGLLETCGGSKFCTVAHSRIRSIRK
jgi:hypothetical protein